MINDVKWYVGIDWATQSHCVCLLDAEGKRVGQREFVHGGAGLAELCDWLFEKTQAAPGQIAVAIETPHGPVVEMLLERGFAVFAINPKQLDRFRDRFTVAGAKDDRRDAHVLGGSLRTDTAAFRKLAADNPVTIELREWSRMADELKQERTRLANRLRQQLWRYYPQAAKLTDDVADDWFLALWQKVPTPESAAKASEKAIARILTAHRIRRLDAATALKTLRETPLFVAPGTTQAACAHIRSLAARLHLVNQQIKEAQQNLDRLCAQIEGEENASGQSFEQCDVTILRSWPGIGRINLATLLVEAAEPLRTTRLPRLARFGRGCSSDAAKRQAALRGPTPRLQQAAAERRPSLVACRHPTRCRRPATL